MSHFWCVQIHHCDQFPKELVMGERVHVFEHTKRFLVTIKCLSQLYTFGLCPSQAFPSHIQESPNDSDHLHTEILEFSHYFRGPSMYFGLWLCLTYTSLPEVNSDFWFEGTMILNFLLHFQVHAGLWVTKETLDGLL